MINLSDYCVSVWPLGRRHDAGGARARDSVGPCQAEDPEIRSMSEATENSNERTPRPNCARSQQMSERFAVVYTR